MNGKTYFINSKLNSKCLDIAYWSKDAGANIQQWDYLNQANQQWILEQQSNGYYVIKSAYSGMWHGHQSHPEPIFNSGIKMVEHSNNGK